MTDLDAGLTTARRALLEQRIAQAARRATEGSPARLTSAPAPLAAAGVFSAGAETDGDVVRVAPLAVAQRPIWWLAQLAPGQPTYNEVVRFTKSGPLDVSALRATVADLVARHDAWRTTFHIRDGNPVQVVHRVMPVDIPLLDLRRLPPAAAEAAAVEKAVELARQPYDLERGPLLRALLMRLGPASHRLYVALHHLAFDGVSLYRVVLPELVALYDAHASGNAVAMPAPTAQYADFVEWERAQLASQEAPRRVEFQRRRLAGSPTLNLPLDRPRRPQLWVRGAVEPMTVPGPVVDQLRRVAADCSGTLFQVLAAANAVLLQRFCGQDDISFGTVTDLRRRRELVPIVGMCLSSVVLRARLEGDPRFVDLVQRLRNDLADALDYHVPFDELVRELQTNREPGLHPLFQVAFVLEPPVLAPDPTWSLTLMEAKLGDALAAAKFDLHLELDERPEGHLSGRLLYNTDLFDRETARRLAQAFQVLVAAVGADAERRISELPVLSDSQRQQLLVDWNATQVDFPEHARLADLLEEQASTSPDAAAVSFAGRRLTYQQLHEAANALAHRLGTAGAGTGTVVGLLAERSLEMVVGLLAIVKSGAAYLPLDPSFPPARLNYALTDAQARVLLAAPALVERLGDQEAKIIDLSGCLEARAETSPRTQTGAGDAVYVLHTSGSTGPPKGVVVSHRALVNLLTGMADLLELPPGGRVLAITTISFDIAAVEIWLPLLTGREIVLASRVEALDPVLLGKLIEDEGITVAQATPTTWQALVDAGWSGARNLVAICGGETLSAALAARLVQRCAQVWNFYGPTETTVWSTADLVSADGQVSIGRPIRNTSVYLLDKQLRPVPIGVPGEIYLGGAGVATCYLNRPKLTAERFVPDLLRPNERMYRTGDVARYLPDGRLLHLGRVDQQIKIRGHRVEPAEVEAALLDQPGVVAAAVVLREDAPGDLRLVAYVAPGAAATSPSPGALRAALQVTLPDYMVPAAFVWLDTLPMTANRKLDRQALPPPETSDVAKSDQYAGRQTRLERRLARIWARVLGLDCVGPLDDFFELGGHSLLAVRLVAEIQSELGIELPISMLIGGESTVRALAGRLDAPRRNAPTRPRSVESARLEVIRFNTAGSWPPLIVMFPSRESLLSMRYFQAPFDERQPLVGLLAGLDQTGRFPRSGGAEQVARDALPTVRNLQPQGAPYRIAGYSLAGLFAYELAGLLNTEGSMVEWLGLIDTYSPNHARRTESVQGSLERARRRTLRENMRSARTGLWSELTVLQADLAARTGRRPLDRFDLRGARRLGRAYSPTGHSIPVDLFVTQASAEGGDLDLGWSLLHHGRLRVHRMPGDHVSIVRGVATQRLAETLAATLPGVPDADVR
jgi:amino acid adenylation domain-containing protein